MASLTATARSSLDAASLALLADLAETPWAGDFYVAGSAGLALYLDHRPVRDLDLMSSVQRLRAIDRRDLLEDLVTRDPHLVVETARDGFFSLRTGAGIALRLYYYPYPLVDREEWVAEMPVASPVDLGLMKLGAIISRGSRRDFVDLYLLCRRLPLSAILNRSADKFGHVEDFTLQAFKALADRSQIDGEPMPLLNRHLDWSAIDSWLAGEVRRLARDRVGLGGSKEE